MGAMESFRSGRFARWAPEARRAAARQALALCVSADALAREAEVAADADMDDDRLFSLLEHRDEMLRDLAEQVLVLRQERPTADSPLYAATERAVDDADALLAEVAVAVSTSHRVTMQLAAKVAQRAEDIRRELDAVQRASHAGFGYGAAAGPLRVDRVR